MDIVQKNNFTDSVSLVRKYKRKRQPGRDCRRLEDNIKMDLRELGLEGLDWIQLAQDKVQ
jgi:hypothetical protein